MQNDDWYYYVALENLKNGNFSLSPDIAPTLYLQLFLSLPFAFLFGINNVSKLTLLFSIFGVLVFYNILKRQFKLSTFFSLATSFLLLFNPLFSYSVWGFMTENFHLFFMLVGIYFFIKYQNSHDGKSLFYVNSLALAGFFIRQISLFFFLGTSMFFFVTKKYKEALKQLFWFLSTYAFYEFIFPKTLEMQSKGLQFHHFFDTEYVLAIIIGACLYLTAFSLPLILFFASKRVYDLVRSKEYLKLSLCLIIASATYFLISKFFNPEAVSWGEFPYFENVFERKGFYPRSLHGTKYHFYGIYDLYYYWEFAAKVLLAFFIGTLVTLKPKKIFTNPYLILLGTCLSTLIVATTFYDRYILILIPLFFFFLLDLQKSEDKTDAKLPKKATLFLNTVLVTFVIFMGVLSYEFSRDFVSVENYVWKTSTSLVSQGVPSANILSSSAWNEKYQRSREPQYLFSYDSPEVNEEIKSLWKVKETHTPKFFGNFYINPKVYLYERK